MLFTLVPVKRLLLSILLFASSLVCAQEVKFISVNSADTTLENINFKPLQKQLKKDTLTDGTLAAPAKWMARLSRKLTRQQRRDSNIYIFFCPSGTGSVKAFLPLSGKYGYVLFDTSRTSVKETQKLKEKLRTHKYQWDYIHDPENILFTWLEDESEGEDRKIQFRTISGKSYYIDEITQIKNYKNHLKEEPTSLGLSLDEKWYLFDDVAAEGKGNGELLAMLPKEGEYEYIINGGKDGSTYTKINISEQIEKVLGNEELYSQYFKTFNYPEECGKGYYCEKLSIHVDNSVNRIEVKDKHFSVPIVLRSYFNSFSVEKISDNGFAPGITDKKLEIKYNLTDKSGKILKLEIGNTKEVLFTDEIPVGDNYSGVYYWDGTINQGMNKGLNLTNYYYTYDISEFYVKIDYINDESFLQTGLSLELDIINDYLEEQRIQENPILRILEEFRTEDHHKFTETIDLYEENLYYGGETYDFISIELNFTNSDDCEYIFETNSNKCSIEINSSTYWGYQNAIKEINGERIEVVELQLCDLITSPEQTPYKNSKDFFIYTTPDKMEKLIEYIFPSNYNLVVQEVFSSIEVGEETEIVIDHSEYLDSDGTFLSQQNLTDCNCYCASAKYIGASPKYKNYLFNKVFYASDKDIISLKDNDGLIEKQIKSNNVNGEYPTLTDTYEVVSFETERLKEAIFEINDRLEKDIPTMVGVTYGAKEYPYNDPGYTTDHYIVIVAKGRDSDGVYFRYLDPGTNDGFKADRKLYINKDLVILGDCYRNNDKYYLVELRLEDKLLNSCLTNPEVDPSVVKLRTDYKREN